MSIPYASPLIITSPGNLTARHDRLAQLPAVLCGMAGAHDAQYHGRIEIGLAHEEESDGRVFTLGKAHRVVVIKVEVDLNAMTLDELRLPGSAIEVFAAGDGFCQSTSHAGNLCQVAVRFCEDGLHAAGV